MTAGTKPFRHPAERTRFLEAAIVRLVEENACLRHEAAELRARLARAEGHVDIHGQLLPARRDDLARQLHRARQLSADGAELLLQGVFYACYDWIVEGTEPVLDQERVRQEVEPLMAGLTDAFRAEISRQGLTAGELDARLRWPQGRTERVLAEPSELGSSESLLLCEVLGTTMMDLLPPRKDVDP